MAELTEYAALLRDLGSEREDVVVIDAGLATAMQTERFKASFPDRYFNLGIAEQNAVGVASGLARRGFTPLVHSFSNFLTRRAHDQVAVSVSWPGVGVKLIAGSCGIYDGRNGPSHMATDDLAAMAALPAMLVAEPGDASQTGPLLRRAVDHHGPAYLRLRRHGTPSGPLTAGEPGTVLVRADPGAVCTVVSGGSMLAECLDAAGILQRRGLPIELIHVAVLKPFDEGPVIASTARTGVVVTVENHGLTGGYGDAVARVAGPLGVRHLRMGIPDESVPAGDADWLLAHCGLDAASIAEMVAAASGGNERRRANGRAALPV